MSSPPATPKSSRKIDQVVSDNPLHNLYQVIYNPTADQSEIPRYAFHCFLNEKGGWLTIRVFALVNMEEDPGKASNEAITIWKGYERLSHIESSTSIEDLAQSIISGEMHISGDQKKHRHKSTDEITAKLIGGNNQAQCSDFMDICCDSIQKLHSTLRQGSSNHKRKKSAVPNDTYHEIRALRKENEKLQQELREARRQYSAAIGGYDKVDPKTLVVNQAPKGTSKLQPSIKQ
ncbi:hypothetical protein QFC19_008067 [Naganishia cerealis]|uniref:Uncharacterized protein n=1 Tax=Naganishia cerealis TaxID=610337 RepID=A0ACC2V4V5_9TREE|nr:hypothetical protein QFC19_008067 [Naganishia cerealis]